MANYQPPTEDVPIFNGKYFLPENITTAIGDARYLKLIAQTDEDMNNYDILNINQVDTQSVKFGDGTIQTTAGGGGGGVNNPMTANLDAGGYNIFNLTRTNETETPVLYNYGAITPQEYGILRVPNRINGTSITMIQLRALDLGLSHQLLLQVIAYADKSVIRIINNVAESDTPVFTNIRYGQDPVIASDNVLTFQAGVSATNVEYSIFQNGNDIHSVGTNFLPITTATPVALTNIFTEIEIELNTSGTSGNWRTKNTTFALDTQTGSLSTQQIRNITGGDIVSFANLTMNNNNLKQVDTIAVDTIGVNAGSEIQVNNNMNMGLNDLQNTNNIFINSISETTPANNIVMNNQVSLGTNKIVSLGQPTDPQDGATKSYVDSQVGGGVQNPMTSNLDGANFRITSIADPVNTYDVANKNYVDLNAGGVQNPMIANLDCASYTITGSSNIQGSTIQTQPNLLTGRMLSNGIFTHGGGAAGEFQCGGTLHRFAPQDNWKIQNFAGNTDYFDYEQSSQTLTTKNGATQAIDTTSTLTFSSGGTLQMYLNPNLANQNEELSLLNVGGAGTNQILQTQGQADGIPNIPQSLNPVFMINMKNDDVSIFAPFTQGLGWNNTSDGEIIPLEETNSMTGRYGEPYGVNDNQVNCLPYNSYLTAIGINNANVAGGWICSGGATIELVYTLTGLIDQSFVPPVIIAQAGGSFGSENIRIPYASWLYANRLVETGVALSLKLNIPVGTTIDTQSPLNSRVNANKIQIGIIEMA